MTNLSKKVPSSGDTLNKKPSAPPETVSEALIPETLTAAAPEELKPAEPSRGPLATTRAAPEPEVEGVEWCINQLSRVNALGGWRDPSESRSAPRPGGTPRSAGCSGREAISAALGLIRPRVLSDLLLWLYAEQGNLGALAEGLASCVEFERPDCVQPRLFGDYISLSLRELRLTNEMPSQEVMAGSRSVVSKQDRAQSFGVSASEWAKHDKAYQQTLYWLRFRVRDAMIQFRRGLRG